MRVLLYALLVLTSCSSSSELDVELQIDPSIIVSKLNVVVNAVAGNDTTSKSADINPNDRSLRLVGGDQAIVFTVTVNVVASDGTKISGVGGYTLKPKVKHSITITIGEVPDGGAPDAGESTDLAPSGDLGAYPSCATTACPTGQTCVSTVCLPTYGFGSGTYSVENDLEINPPRLGINGTSEDLKAVGTFADTHATGATPPTTFNRNDLVILHQAFSTALTPGFVPGTWETAVVASQTDSQLNFFAPLQNRYTVGAQVVRVTEYGKLAITTGDTLRGPAWDGTTGGILAVKVADTFVSGALGMGGRGYRGAPAPAMCTHCESGQPGESTAGFATNTATGVCTNATAGDVNANASGGGGGGGPGDCTQGGGGAHANNGGNGAAYSLNPNAVQGFGGIATSDPDLTQHILFGGAGGQGGLDDDGDYPGQGGAGGGIIIAWLHAATASPAPIFNSTGAAGTNGQFGQCPIVGQNVNGCYGMGGGGGGAGGSILVYTTSAIATGLQVGGAGGGTCANSADTCGNGMTTGSAQQAAVGGAGSVGRTQVVAP